MNFESDLEKVNSKTPFCPLKGPKWGQPGPNPIFCQIIAIFTVKGPFCKLLTMAKSNFRKYDFTTVQKFQKGPFPVKMVKIGPKIRFVQSWPHLAHLGWSKGILELTFTKFEPYLIHNLLWGTSGANLVKIASWEPIF